jgi:hypothetical protein
MIINISDSTFERLRFEAIEEDKSIQEIISERLFHKPFSADVEEAFEKLIDQEFQDVFKERLKEKKSE